VKRRLAKPLNPDDVSYLFGLLFEPNIDVQRICALFELIGNLSPGIPSERADCLLMFLSSTELLIVVPAIRCIRALTKTDFYLRIGAISTQISATVA
jgi:hypothetical protein